jgi:transposase
MEKVKQNSFKNQSFFIGIDVHLKNWEVTIRNNHMVLRTLSMNPSPRELARHLKHNYPGGVYFSVYEAGFCGYWIHRELGRLGIHNIVIHPADVPTSDKEKQNKTDGIDSHKLARELENQALKSIYIPNEAHQQLRALRRLRDRQVQNMTRVKNRIKSHLHMNGIEIPSHAEVSHWSERFIQWLASLEFSIPAGTDYLRICIEELRDCRARIVQIVRSLRSYCTEFGIKELIGNLRSIPGIGFITAITFYTELMDIYRFRTLDHMSSFVGLVPSVHSSGDHEWQGTLTNRKNSYLRHMLVEAGWIAIRKDAALLLAFNNLTKRMSKQKAIIRIARKLLNRIRYVWLNQQSYVYAVVE